MTSIKNNYNIKKKIRQKIRFIRHNLTQQEQYEEAQKITNYIINDKRIKQARYIGLFFSFDNEIDTKYLIKKLLYLGKKIYLPIINPVKKSKQLLFSQYTLSTCLKYNQFKIYEPKIQKKSLISIKKLDIIFIPLIAFDNNGNRLGMGGGFYDSTLRDWNHHFQKYLIGLAYDFQKINEIMPTENWDISLSEIITPSNHWMLKNTKFIKKLIQL